MKYMFKWRLWVIVFLSTLGFIVKFIGGYLYCSKALFVDALTNIANIIALVATVYYYLKAYIPPDSDHHFGHYRLGFAGTLITIIIYAFIAGVVVCDLLHVREYTVKQEAPILALLGLLLYSSVVYLSRTVSEYLTVYGLFTVSEVLESIIVIVASALGYLYTYIIDYVGATIIALYILYELQHHLKYIIKLLSDIAPPVKLVNSVRMTVEKYGVKVKRIRLRLVKNGLYQGDIVVSFPPNTTVKEAHEISNMIERELKDKYNVDVVVHIEP
ncbi:MAG TPA: cation diffusion facilitator family transporter [Desulfurococcales archaeon]|nr:cation diffusion facilitator family transporter [Desulfurococcales archaeon]